MLLCADIFTQVTDSVQGAVRTYVEVRADMKRWAPRHWRTGRRRSRWRRAPADTGTTGTAAGAPVTPVLVSSAAAAQRAGRPGRGSAASDADAPGSAEHTTDHLSKTRHDKRRSRQHCSSLSKLRNTNWALNKLKLDAFGDGKNVNEIRMC